MELKIINTDYIHRFAFVGGGLLESGGDALGGVIGCDSFAAEIINPVVDYFVFNTVAKYALFQIIEQAIDKGKFLQYSYSHTYEF